MVSYTRPYLYPKQLNAIFSPKRWALCEASTKSGKTVASIVRIIEWGLFGNGISKDHNGNLLPVGPGQHYWWVAPVSEQARIAFTRVKQRLTAGTFRAKESPVPTIELATGPDIVFKSGDNPDSLYGEDVFGAVIDEASRCRADSWFAVRSTLTATRGPAVIIGNVKGRKNWFYEFCRRVEAGKEPNGSFARITWRDAVMAGVLELEEIQDARRNLPESVFRELYEAVANDDSGNPFGEDHIYACVRPRLSEKPTVAFGVDLAKKQDYLVVIGLDDEGNTTVFQRWQGKKWEDSIKMIWDIVGEDVPVLVDSTGVGDFVVERLQVDHGNIQGYIFSGPSKQRLMEGLAVGIQSGEIGFPDNQIKTELLSFTYEITRTGVRYSAPEGYNDDCVCALALARAQWSQTAPGAAIMEFYKGQHANALAAQEREELGLPPKTKPPQLHTVRSPGQELADLLADPEELRHNELTDLYDEVVSGYERPKNVCRRCAKPIIGPSRVSDGFNVWHEGCFA